MLKPKRHSLRCHGFVVHALLLCMHNNVANEIDNEIDKAWTNIPGIHDNGPRDHDVWRLTLTAYTVHFEFVFSEVCEKTYESLIYARHWSDNSITQLHSNLRFRNHIDFCSEWLWMNVPKNNPVLKRLPTALLLCP